MSQHSADPSPGKPWGRLTSTPAVPEYRATDPTCNKGHLNYTWGYGPVGRWLQEQRATRQAGVATPCWELTLQPLRCLRRCPRMTTQKSLESMQHPRGWDCHQGQGQWGRHAHRGVCASLREECCYSCCALSGFFRSFPKRGLVRRGCMGVDPGPGHWGQAPAGTEQKAQVTCATHRAG